LKNRNSNTSSKTACSTICTLRIASFVHHPKNLDTAAANAAALIAHHSNYLAVQVSYLQV